MSMMGTLKTRYWSSRGLMVFSVTERWRDARKCLLHNPADPPRCSKLKTPYHRRWNPFVVAVAPHGHHCRVGVHGDSNEREITGRPRKASQLVTFVLGKPAVSPVYVLPAKSGTYVSRTTDDVITKHPASQPLRARITTALKRLLLYPQSSSFCGLIHALTAGHPHSAKRPCLIGGSGSERLP